jgi:predicted MFS family arabinose efflux permease
MGLALGVTAGGVLLTVGSWPWIFWFNLPVVAGCLIAAVPALRFSARPLAPPLALSASLLVSATVVAVVLAGTELARPTPSGVVVTAACATALATLALLLITQRRRARPLVASTLLRVQTLRVACAVAALYMASFGAEFFLVTLYLQEQRGYTALAAGLAFLPLAATIVIGNTVAGRAASRWPLRRLLTTGYGTGAVGLAILGLAAATSGSYASALLPGLLISGLGQGMAFTGMTGG